MLAAGRRYRSAPIQIAPGRWVHTRTLGQFMPTCPTDFSPDLCQRRDALITQLITFQVAGAYPFTQAAAETAIDDMLHSVQTATTDAAKPYIVQTVLLGLLATVITVGISVAVLTGTVKKCKAACPR